MSARPAASSAHLDAEPNVTPMIDVLLVLLIMFMLMIQRRSALDVQLPAPVTEQEGLPATPIVLSVAPGPTYALNRQPVAPGALAATIARTYAGRPDKLLWVAGDSGVTYQQVVSAMDVAKGAGVRVLAIAPRRSQ